MNSKLLAGVLFVAMALLFVFLIVVYGIMAIIQKMLDPVFFWLLGTYASFSDERK